MGTINHIKTSIIADGTNTNLVRPSDWNSIHAYTMQDAVSLSGNTSGVLANISSGTCYLAGGNNVTLSQNANSVTISAAVAGTASYWPHVLPASTAVSTYYSGSTSQGAAANSTQSGYTFSIYVIPLVLPAALAFSNLYMMVSNGTAGATGSVTHVYSAGFYTNNANTLSLVKGYYGGLFLSQNSSNAWTYSVWTVSTGGNTAGGPGGFAGLAVSSIRSSQGNVNSSLQLNGSMKYARIDNGAATTLTQGQYFFAFANCSVSSVANVFSIAGWMQSNAISSNAILEMGLNTSATANSIPGWGAISTTFTSVSNAASWFALPNAIDLANMTSNSTAQQRFHFPIMRNL